MKYNNYIDIILINKVRVNEKKFPKLREEEVVIKYFYFF